MEPYYGPKRSSPSRNRKSRPAFYLLVLFGCVIIFFSLALIACAFVINYADDFEASDTMEETVQSQFNYSQYWAGIPFLITGVLVMFSGIWQRSRGLTITTVAFCFLCVALTLLIVAFESGPFHTWNFAHRRKLYWDSKSGYTCTSSGTLCSCTDGTTSQQISALGDCDDISALSALYGVVIGSAVIITLFCFFSIIIIVKSISWKRLRYVQQMYYPEEYYMPERRAPSVVEVPQTFAREYPVDKYGGEQLPYKQTIYRNYPY